jgi:predicted transcriptional regulator
MATNLVISLPPDLERALSELARRSGVAPEDLVVDALRDRLSVQEGAIEPRDAWERLILDAGTNCGVSLPDEALGIEGLYE